MWLLAAFGVIVPDKLVFWKLLLLVSTLLFVEYTKVLMILPSEVDLLKYKDQRKEEYPDWGTQLDYIYHNGIDKWKTDIVDPVKAKYPKPS